MLIIDFHQCHETTLSRNSLALNFKNMYIHGPLPLYPAWEGMVYRKAEGTPIFFFNSALFIDKVYIPVIGCLHLKTPKNNRTV